MRLTSLCGLLLLLASSPEAQPDTTSAPVIEDVQFESGAVTLAGTVLLPSGSGPFPGVVIVHGSGTSDRSNPWTVAYAEALVERGVAVLHPDKRGSGASGGDWREATFLDLADDVLAAVRHLRAHPAVEADKVGVIGFSQGGHVVPVAAARSPEVAFVIDVSGSVVPIMEQIGDEIVMMGEREGLNDEEIETVRAVHELGMQYALTGEGWDAYADALADAKEGGLGGRDVIEGFPTEPDTSVWSFLRTLGDFDPLPYWREVDVPTLFLFGGRDENVDVYKSADLIETTLTETGLPYSLLLFRNNGHALFREDAMDFIARWIHDGGQD